MDAGLRVITKTHHLVVFSSNVSRLWMRSSVLPERGTSSKLSHACLVRLVLFHDPFTSFFVFVFHIRKN